LRIVERNAARVEALLSGAAVNVTAHVAEIAVGGEDGVIALVTAEPAGATSADRGVDVRDT
jgi:hypothetical protein